MKEIENVEVIYVFKINIKRNLLEDFVTFLDTTTKQNSYFKIIIIFFTIMTTLFLIFLLFKYLNE